MEPRVLNPDTKKLNGLSVFSALRTSDIALNMQSVNMAILYA
jgi:hypothetical protein